MGIAEAKKYLIELRKKQSDPALWPDFLTGLPDKRAVIKKIVDVYPKNKKAAVSYVRIANIHPYLAKHGTSRHAEIIQWAAAILKSTMDKCTDGFVGTVGIHDFVAVCSKDKIDRFLDTSSKAFERKIKGFYGKDELKSNTVLTFDKNGRTISLGLMRLVHCVVNSEDRIPAPEVLRHLTERCGRLESC